MAVDADLHMLLLSLIANSGHGNISVLRQCLDLCCEVLARSPKGFAFVHGQFAGADSQVDTGVLRLGCISVKFQW